MADFHQRVWMSAENIFTGALGAFQAERWRLAEIMAAEVMGLCMFLMHDPETPEKLKDRAEVFGLQAKGLTYQARSAWVDKRVKPRMQSIRSGIDRELDEAWEESKAAVQAAVSQ